MRDDYYRILELDVGATDTEIKKAYRRLATMYHSDAPGGGNIEKFIKINEAYTILSDRKSRLIYDRTGEAKSSANNANTEAMLELQRVILALFDEDKTDEIFYTNLPKRLNLLLKQNIAKSGSTISNCRKAISKLKRFKNKFKFKKKSLKDQDFITIGLNGRILGYRSDIYVELEKIRQFKLMLELLKSYDYEMELRFTPPSFL